MLSFSFGEPASLVVLSFVHFFLETLMQMNKRLSLLVPATIGGLIASGTASAAADVTAITAVVADVGVVAAAVFGVFVAIKAAKFIRRAL